MPFLNILMDIIAPIFVLITVGYLFQKTWHFDLRVLTRILLYLVMPAALVVSLTQSELANEFVWQTSIFCLFVVSAGRTSARNALLESLKMPFVYALGLAFLIRHYGLQPPSFFWVPMEYLAEALVPMALVTLGMQLARTHINQAWQAGLASLVCRLLISPIIGYGLVLLLDVDPSIAPILVVSASHPTAINTVLIAMEFGSEEDFAANAVLLSTICSTITVAVAIYLVR